MVPVQLRLLTHIAPYEGLGDRPTENPMRSDAHHAAHSGSTWILLNLYVCCPTCRSAAQPVLPAMHFAHALQRPPSPCVRPVGCAPTYKCVILFITKISPEGVNGKLRSTSRSRVRDPCNMIARAMERCTRAHLTTHSPTPNPLSKLPRTLQWQKSAWLRYFEIGMIFYTGGLLHRACSAVTLLTSHSPTRRVLYYRS